MHTHTTTVVVIASQIEDQLQDYQDNPDDAKWKERYDIFKDLRVDRCLTKIEDVMETSQSSPPPPPPPTKNTERPLTPTQEVPQNHYFSPPPSKKPFVQQQQQQKKRKINTNESLTQRKKKKKNNKSYNNNPLSKFLEMDPDKLKELYDISMAYCGKCGEGGDMFCCSSCPGVYHAKCVGLKSVPDDDWYCDWCKSTDENVRNILRFSELKDKKRCMCVLSTLRKNDYASVFEDPVDIPGYKMFIKKPMCFSVVQKNLLGGVYDADIRGMFRDDLELIFKNCMEFNQPSSGIWRLAQILTQFYMRTEDGVYNVVY